MNSLPSHCCILFIVWIIIISCFDKLDNKKIFIQCYKFSMLRNIILFFHISIIFQQPYQHIHKSRKLSATNEVVKHRSDNLKKINIFNKCYKLNMLLNIILILHKSISCQQPYPHIHKSRKLSAADDVVKHGSDNMKNLTQLDQAFHY